MTVGERIKQRRKELGLSADELAENSIKTVPLYTAMKAATLKEFRQKF